MKTSVNTKINDRCLVFAGLMLLAFLNPAPSFGQNITNTIPFRYSFEDYTPSNTLINGTNGWYADADTYATVINTNYTYALSRPLGGTHTNAVQLNTEGGAISNVVNDLSNRGNPTITNIWIDTMVQFTPWSLENFPSITNDANVRSAFFVDTNGLLVIYHSETANFSSGMNRFTTLNNTPINTNEWVRLTVTCDFMTDFNDNAAPFFKVQLNGGTALSNEFGFSSPATASATTNGPWFCFANFFTKGNPYNVTNVSFSGTGYFDDFVVTNGDPLAVSGPITWAIVSSVFGGGGNIFPLGVTNVIQGSNATFTITPSNYWQNSGIWTNGASNAPATSFTFTNVTTTNAIQARFIMITAETNNTPAWWMAQYGINTNGGGGTNWTTLASLDQDNDNMTTWEEYLAGTDPTNSSSYFSIRNIYNANGTTFVSWVTSTNMDTSLPPFGIVRRTNLMDVSWTLVDGNVVRVKGTNIWAETSPMTNVPAFYRVVATNNVP